MVKKLKKTKYLIEITQKTTEVQLEPEVILYILYLNPEFKDIMTNAKFIKAIPSKTSDGKLIEGFETEQFILEIVKEGKKIDPTFISELLTKSPELEDTAIIIKIQ